MKALKYFTMVVTSQFHQVSLSVTNVRTYLFGALFVLGNIVLPQICHLIPDGGKMFLPIYFFTLIAGYKFGFKVGLLTAVLSPLCNHLLFGMPPLAVLPILLVKSSLLAVAAAWIAHKSRKLSLLHVAAVVMAYQLAGGVAEWLMTSSLAAALQDFRLGFPGMIFQIVAGWVVLKWLAGYQSK